MTDFKYSFYPGPSKPFGQISGYFSEAIQKNIFSLNHRSSQFVEIVRQTRELLGQKWGLPENYRVFFCASATECWEIVLQNWVLKENIHVFNGAFGEKWADYAIQLCPRAKIKCSLFRVEERLPTHFQAERDSVICLTHNETSNGTYLPEESILEIRRNNPDALIAFDATSSMGGLNLNWELGDIWFASVQKCMGLPAGMALLVCSEQAVEKALQINQSPHYNSIARFEANMLQFQTTHTPNTLGIYLLFRLLQDLPPLAEQAKHLLERAASLYDFFDNEVQLLNPLVQNADFRSPSVVTLSARQEVIQKIKQKAEENSILLGNGYGTWKNTTLRIANFPAIEDSDFDFLKDFFSTLKID